MYTLNFSGTIVIGVNVTRPRGWQLSPCLSNGYVSSVLWLIYSWPGSRFAAVEMYQNNGCKHCYVFFYLESSIEWIIIWRVVEAIDVIDLVEQ